MESGTGLDPVELDGLRLRPGHLGLRHTSERIWQPPARSALVRKAMTMARAIVRRLIWLVPIVLGLSLLTFSLVAFLPGDAAQALAGTGASEQDIQALRTSLGLDQPLPVQYLRYLSRLVQGDLGRSPVTGRPVATEIMDNLPPTLELAAFAMVFSILVGVTLGVVSALRHNTIWDTAAAILSVIG